MTAYIKNESDLPQPRDYDPLMHRRDTYLDELAQIVREMEIALVRITEGYVGPARCGGGDGAGAFVTTIAFPAV